MTAVAECADVAIIGGGISGLAAAWSAIEFARKHGRELRVVVFEASSEVGGKVQTHRFAEHGGYLFEAGPNGFLDRTPIVQRLAQLANVHDHIIETRSENPQRWIYWNGAKPAAPHPWTLLRGGLLSPLGVLRMLSEPLRATRSDATEESLHDFAARRLGVQAAERIVSAMALGVYAGDSRRLSTDAFPSLSAFERDSGSLFAGIRHQVAERKRVGQPAPRLKSFRQGMQTLPEALAATDRFSTFCSTRVDAIRRESNGTYHCAWTNSSTRQSGSTKATTVVLASDLPASADLLEPLAQTAAAALRAIPCPPVLALGALFRRSDLPKLPDGFGLLVPPSQSPRMLGCLFESQVFEQRSSDQTVFLRFLIGGRLDPGILQEQSDQRQLAIEQTKAFTVVNGPPLAVHSAPWQAAIPQVEVGHQRRVEAIEARLQALPSLLLAGNATHGVAFPDAASRGWEQGESAAKIATESTIEAV